MNNIKVIFNSDPTGMSEDITKELSVPSDTCIFDFHDSCFEIDRIKDMIKKLLNDDGYQLSSEHEDYLYILKAYLI